MFAPASVSRLAANRANAQKSTGPRTEEGKANSRKNALRHGLTAKSVVLTVEDTAEYEAFRARILESFAPTPGVEQRIAEELADALWRLKRAQRIEAAAFDHYLDTIKREIYPEDAEARDALESEIGLGVVIGEEYAEPFRKLFRYVGANERYYLRLQAQLLKLQAERRRNGFVSSSAVRPVQVGQVVAENGSRVRAVHADSLQDGALLSENALYPSAWEERGVRSE
jgi:hypothetical protein